MYNDADSFLWKLKRPRASKPKLADNSESCLTGLDHKRLRLIPGKDIKSEQFDSNVTKTRKYTGTSLLSRVRRLREVRSKSSRNTSPKKTTPELTSFEMTDEEDTDGELRMSWKNLNKNSISAFEEFGVKNGHTPAVEIVSVEGPQHKPVFIASAKLGSRVVCEERGCSKHEARVLAAESALNILSIENPQQKVEVNTDIEDNSVNPVPDRDPVSALMEYAQFKKVPLPAFNLADKDGPPHMPIFSIGVRFQGETYDTADARSMKEAKKKAACIVLNQLNKEGRLAECFPSCKFTQSSPLPEASLSLAGRNPISELNEFCQKRCLALRFENKSIGPSHRPEFTVWAVTGGREYEPVTASNLKAGRSLAAQKALDFLEKKGRYRPGQQSSSNGFKVSNHKPSTLFEKIASAALNKIDRLMLNTPLVGRKVVAAIVMSDNDKLTVISVGSGNRCLKGDQLKDDGTVLHDSHAEVLARRGFKRYLYKLLEDESQTMLRLGSSGKWTFKRGVAFHLYISTAPCGDGALFVHNEKNEHYFEDSPGNKHEPVFSNTKTQGLLRVKQENGEGTIPIEQGYNGQTFDGIHAGERLKIMSCSDKICRWNVLGLQGALLSTKFEPVYLQSLVIGNLYHHGHLSRAVCCRTNVGGDSLRTRLRSGYYINHVDLGLVSTEDTSRAVEKSRSHCLNWCLGDEKPEITDGTTGMTSKMIKSGAAPSQLCKQAFLHLYRTHIATDNLPNVTYGVHKLDADEYNQAKMAFKSYMKVKGFGTWIEMPKEVTRF